MRGNDEKVVEIEIERLHDFKNHPFKVQAKNEILNSTTTFGGGIYSRTVKVYSFI